MQEVDILILSNGPGELATWVRPVVEALREKLGNDRTQVRISIVLSPCTHATGKEGAIARSYPQVDRVQEAQHFFPFLLSGKTAENWDWRSHGVVLFLGGDQFFPVIIGKRLGYRTVIYAEWEARWYRWVDRFGVMNPDVVAKVPQQYAHKCSVVGDLMTEVSSNKEGGVGAAVGAGLVINSDLQPITLQQNPPLLNLQPITSEQNPPVQQSQIELIGLLVGSKPAKLAQGVPLMLAIAEHIHSIRPQTRFVVPVAPTLDLQTLARFGNPQQNPIIEIVGGTSAELIIPEPPELPFLKTAAGLNVELWTRSPAYDLLSQCRICITTVGANTAELGALAIPMIVILPTQQLDAMRAWDGLPGLLANLPGLGSLFAKLINSWVLKQGRLFAWPNIWAKQEIVPELVGKLQASDVAQLVIDYLDNPEKLQQMSDRLRAVRGQAGAAQKIAQIVSEELLNN